MPNNGLLNSRHTGNWFAAVQSAKDNFVKGLGKDAKMEDSISTEYHFPDFNEDIQTTNFAAAFKQAGFDVAFKGKTNKDVVEHFNQILKQNPAPFFTAPLTNTAVYKALAVAAFVTLSVMTSGIAGALGTALYTTGLAGATYLGFQLAKSHWNAHSSIMDVWNKDQKVLAKDKQAGILGKTGQFLKSFFYEAGVKAFNNQQIVNGDEINGKTKFLDKLKGLTLSSKEEASEWTIRNQAASVAGMALTAIVAFYFSPALLASIGSAVALTGVAPMVANHFKLFEKSETPKVPGADAGKSGRPNAEQFAMLGADADKAKDLYAKFEKGEGLTADEKSELDGYKATMGIVSMG